MCRDSSAVGMLIGTPSRFSVGETMTLTFQVRLHEPTQCVTGKVVRLGMDPDADGWCSRLVAVKFEEPLAPSIETALMVEAPRQAAIYG